MKFNIPKIVKPVSLGEYDESLSEQIIWMFSWQTTKVMRHMPAVQGCATGSNDFHSSWAP